jgi:hypothetical protein
VKSQTRAIHLGIAAIAVAALAISLSFVGTANAFEDPPIKLGAESANLESSAQYLLENSPRKISGIEPTSASEALYDTVTAPSPTADPLVQDELETEVPSLLQKVGVWSWSKVPELAVGVAAGYVGWEIGSAIWGTFFEESPEPVSGIAAPADRWFVTTPSELTLSGGAGNIYTPNTWGMRGMNHWSPSSGTETDTGACETELYGAGVRLSQPGWVPGSGCGISLYREYVLWKPLEVVRCDEGAVTCPGIEPIPYEGEGQPTAPSAEELRKSLKEALESSEDPELNRLYNFEQEPENYPDPRITDEREDHRCDRAPGATYENPGGNETPGAFEKKIEAPFTVTTRPEGFGSTEVFLRWGTTYWKPGIEELEGIPYLDLWGGWGYRHILAKHGWSALDREETELALTTGLPAKTNKESKFVYSAPDIDKGAGGVECIRHVVVDFEAGEGDPSPRGIVTSFNGVG